MATCRVVVTQALQALSALALGDDPSADELSAGLDAIGNVLLDLHESRVPMTDVDVIADYIAAENQRVRVQLGFTVKVTLPDAVPIWPTRGPSDYGFTAALATPPMGSTDTADGVQFRAPRDGTRVEVVGTSQSLSFYRADVNAWFAATGLALDDEAPLNARYTSALAALVAERMIESMPGVFEPTPALARRIARGNLALMLQGGVARDPTAGEYL